MTTPKVILVNGPPRCGKDTAYAAYPSAQLVKFARAVKEGTHGAFGLDVNAYPMDFFEDVKDEPSTLFLGKTPREAYIAYSETFMKPLTGNPSVFGHLTLRSMVMSNAEVFMITDSGFYHEALPLIEHFGAENMLLLRVHREGCNFNNDSRSYIDLTSHGVQRVDVPNNDMTTYIDDVRYLIEEFVGK